MMQPYVRFGDEDRGEDDGAMCDGWYRERQCVLLTEDCYRNVMATPLKVRITYHVSMTVKEYSVLV